MKHMFVVLLALMALIVVATGCDAGTPPKDDQKSAIETAREKAQKRTIYKPVNDVNFDNYNDRAKLADNPATILWCTFFPPGVQGTTDGSTPGQAFTVPIAGKLTDAGNTPFPPAQNAGPDSDGEGTWYPFPAPDGMYGTAGDYRYGFDPTRAIYYDFTDLPAFCTNAPTVWQAEQTQIVVERDSSLANLTNQAEAALKAGDAERALDLLEGADR